VQNVEDVVEELSPMYRAALAPQERVDGAEAERPRGLLPDEQAVLDLLAEPEPAQIDALAERAPFGLARLQSALLGLQLRGLVESLPGGHYGRKLQLSRSGSGVGLHR